mgnify:CR=1 FL=1
MESLRKVERGERKFLPPKHPGFELSTSYGLVGISGSFRTDFTSIPLKTGYIGLGDVV